MAKRGQNIELPIDSRALSLAQEVRRVLPKAARSSRRWTASVICPRCAGPKVTRAKRCWACYRRDRSAARALAAGYARGNRGVASVQSDLDGERMRSAHWHRGKVGVPQPPPVLTRKALGADGVWRDGCLTAGEGA